MTLLRVIISGMCVLLLYAGTLQAQYSPSAREMSLSYSDFCSASGSPLSVNPALLSSANVSLSASVIPSPFGLPDLSLYTIESQIAGLPVPLGVRISTYGGKLYRQNELSMGTAGKINNNFSAGFQLSVNRTTISRYSPLTTFLIGLGIQYTVTDNISMAALLRNLPVTEDEQSLPEGIFGVTIKPAGDVVLSGAVHQEKLLPVYFSTGVDYAAIEFLKLRLGYVSNPGYFTFGFGLNYLTYTLDYAFLNHRILGVVQQVSISVQY